MPDFAALLSLLRLALKDRQQLVLENIALRHQLAVYKRSVKRSLAVICVAMRRSAAPAMGVLAARGALSFPANLRHYCVTASLRPGHLWTPPDGSGPDARNMWWGCRDSNPDGG